MLLNTNYILILSHRKKFCNCKVERKDKKKKKHKRERNNSDSLLTINHQYDKIQALGQLTQLGECLLDVEKVSGSSPLLPTNECSLMGKRKRTVSRTVLFLLRFYFAFSYSKSTDSSKLWLTSFTARCIASLTRVRYFPPTNARF